MRRATVEATDPVYPLPPVETITGRTLCSGHEGMDFWHLCYVEAMKALIMHGPEKLKPIHPNEKVGDTVARQAAIMADAMQRYTR